MTNERVRVLLLLLVHKVRSAISSGKNDCLHNNKTTQRSVRIPRRVCHGKRVVFELRDRTNCVCLCSKRNHLAPFENKILKKLCNLPTRQLRRVTNKKYYT